MKIDKLAVTKKTEAGFPIGSYVNGVSMLSFCLTMFGPMGKSTMQTFKSDLSYLEWKGMKGGFNFPEHFSKDYS